MMRENLLKQLQEDRVFDLLVIGGGATGCGIALDAASRGLSVALVEKNDFAEGTSSRSTKLVHGGVRYLEMAVKHLDRGQYELVRDGLRERALVLKNAPHLSHPLALVTPLYRWTEVPYVYAGLKLYDLLSGKRSLGHSRLLGAAEALKRFPMLKAQGLKAGVLYYDGQFNDARMALSLVLTALEQGAAVLNHVEACALVKEQGRLCGAQLRDCLTGQSWTLRARGVINATGPFADSLRFLDDPEARPLLKLSSGIHIVLDGRFAPSDTGLLIPETEDGRVLFVLPWQGCALVGTTDEPAELSEHPRPQQVEIDYLLRHLGRYFNLEVRREDIRAAWSGLRPLVFDPEAADTAQLARDHVIEVSASGLLTITGGKWTTYRKMAQDAVDRALECFDISSLRRCRTEDIALVGGRRFDLRGEGALIRNFGLPPDVAEHFHHTYGDVARAVGELARDTGVRRLLEHQPYLEAEVIHAVRAELARRPADLLVRRLPLALLDRQAALQALPRVLELMAAELGWDADRCAEEARMAGEVLGGAL